MTATRTQTTAIDHQLILELAIDAEGEVTRKPSLLGRKVTLKGKLLSALYPGIQVARVSVPSELTPYEQSVVESAMAKLVYGGVEYRLVGASNSAKDGKFYFVDLAHARQIAERFQHWPEAAMVYFAILVSDCRVMVDEPDFRVAVVQEHALGTNDCRGWVRESIYRKLRISTNRFCQFRLAFDAQEPKQAKGALKAMSDRVAERLGVDIILPESSAKPALKGGLHFLPQLGTSGRMYTGPAVLGIKEISRSLEFGSSYTLVEHASEESLQLEILPRAIEQIRKVRKAWSEGDHTALLELMGKSNPAPTFEDEDSSFDPEALESGANQVSEEWEPAEAALLADTSGNSIRFPYVANQINRKLARWAFRICTGGGFRLPAFALTDDGVLIEYRGKVLSASDWIPLDTSITSLASEQGLCIRYPIRMQEDLLPVRHLTNDELAAGLKQALGVDLDENAVAYILDRQLRMEGTYILRSETAKRNGGDFDFDTVCVMPSDQFPRFIAGRIAYGEQFRQTKTKLTKAKSPWWNVCLVAMKARGNKIGSITDLKTSCLAAGRPDLAYKLVEQLQNALDSLKHKVEIDEAVIGEIRKEVPPAPWLKFKHERRISDLPAHLEILDTDKVGRLYNVLRKELGFLPQETGFEERMSIEDFRGLFSGETVTKGMFEECQLVNSIYADIASRIVEREEEVKLELANAQALWEAMRKCEDKEQRRSAVLARNKAQAALWEHEKEAREQFSSLHLFVHYWAQGKQENRKAWAQAMNTVVTTGSGSGAVLFQSFPQEIIDAFAAMTGGQRVRVRLPRAIEGYVWFDDQQRAFLVERIENPEGPEGVKRVFLFQYKGKRNLLFEDTSIPAGEVCS